MKVHRLELIFGFSLILMQNFTYMKVPVYFKKMLDEVMGENRWEVFQSNILPVVFYTGMTVTAMVFMRKLIIGVSRKIEFRLRNELYDKLLSMNHGFFQKNETGDLVSRSTNDLDNVRTLLGPGIMYIPNAISRLVIFFPVLFKLNSKLLWIISIMHGSLVILIVIVLPRIRPHYRKIQEFLGLINSQVWQVISGITTIKLYTRERTAVERFKKLNREYLSKQMTLVKRTGFLWPFFLFVISMTELVILLVGGKAFIAQRMSMGELLQFTVMVAHLTFPVLSLGWIMSLMQQGISAMKRIDYILSQPDPGVGKSGTLTGKGIEIIIEGLRFRYPGENREALKDITLEVRPGQVIGIAGPVGSGKTTLLNLISGILQPEPGMIFLNRRDIVTLKPASVMRKVSMVPQTTFLFSRSIGENILMAERENPERLLAVVRSAGFESDLKSFPEGLNQMVGERGITLSGGQKQRIAIARALIKKSPLLIFDDALSGVDSSTEVEILQDIISKRSFETFIFTSHRISSLRYADVIVVLKNGSIIEKGSHADLIRKRKCYYAMARFQQLEEGSV